MKNCCVEVSGTEGGRGYRAAEFFTGGESPLLGKYPAAASRSANGSFCHSTASHLTSPLNSDVEKDCAAFSISFITLHVLGPCVHTLFSCPSAG